MRRGTKTIIILLLVLALLLSGTIAQAEEEKTGSRAADTAVTAINVPFPDVNEKQLYQWEFPYSDAYFQTPSGEFSRDLARATFGLTVSAFRNNKGLIENQYATYLQGAGFSDIYAFGYDKETSKDTLSGVIAHKTIGDFTLIAAAPCGQGYKKEWGGNLEVGDEERHVGFNHAAGILEEEIRGYIQEHRLAGPLKLWLGGFSRASAVANLTAADMIDSGQFEDVYAYLFAVPRTTRKAGVNAYKGIYNICGKFDPVTQIPSQAWGYERYGTDLYTPAMEMDSEYLSLASYASDVSWKLTGKRFWYNPEVSYQLHLIIEFLSELFPTSAEYAEKLQASLMEAWTEPNLDTFLPILSETVDQLENLDQRQEYSSDVFIDYLQYLIASHLKENQEQIDRGFWDPKQGAAENMIREHMPYTYMNWVFSDVETEKLYDGPVISRRVYIYGNVDVEVWKGDVMINGINRRGEIIFPGTFDEEYLYRDVLLTRNGQETLTSIPFDDDYEIRFRTDRDEDIVMYDLYYSPYYTFGSMDTIFHLKVSKGEYTLDCSRMVDTFDLASRSGEILRQQEIPYQYSPTMVMAGESAASYHITIPDLFTILIGVAYFAIALLLVCLIIAIVHKIRKKKRGRPYSPWFVIVPHLIIIVIFTLLTQFFTMYMFSIGVSRQICAALTMAMLILLSLRGLIRNHSIYGGIVTLVMIAAALVNLLVYQKSPLASSAIPVFISYCIIISGLSALAISTFFRHRKPDNA